MHIVRFPPFKRHDFLLFAPQVGAAAVRAESSGGRVGHGPARTEVLSWKRGGVGSGWYT